MPPDLPCHLPAQASATRFAVVGVGASAGGLQALLSLFESLPANPGMAFVVVMHLNATHKSSLAQIIGNATTMPTLQVSEAVHIEPDHVYIIAPGNDLLMADGVLSLKPVQRAIGPQVAIDLFFRQLAMAYQSHAVGVVLSGAGADGSVGIAQIKGQGGVTLAQLPEDAEYESMPRHAIDTGMVDIVLPVALMAERLMTLNSSIRRLHDQPPACLEQPAHEPEELNQGRALREVLALLRVRTGHDFKLYKGATVRRRIERRMQVNGIAELSAYHTYLRDNMAETQALLKDMLIGVTNFFRDAEAFEALERDVLAQLFDEERLQEQEREIRVWSAACSTGEEVYSLAMLLLEQADRAKAPVNVQIFATDIDEQALQVGRKGQYLPGVVADIGQRRVKQHFTVETDLLRIKKEIRERVLFAKHNLLNDPPFSRLDLISCRNFLIYLDREAQATVLQIFHFALRPGGYLFLGNSESAEVCSNLFVAVDKKLRIYRARNASRVIRATTMSQPPPPPRTVMEPALPEPGRKKISFADIHQRVLEQYAPPSVIIDQACNIVHTSARVGRFLRYVAGEPTHNLLALVQPELRLELRTAVFQASQSGKSVEARRVRTSRDERQYYINMIVRPFSDSSAMAEYMLVLFDEVEDVMGTEVSASHEGKDSVLTQLEAELQRTKEQLQFTIEHSDTSTEELKASNEELQAINEELRSASEELETSKEELQSINEELSTVNAELKAKIEETGKINDDLQNLITSTNIGTVFVDRVMRIKWFTPQAAQVFNMIESDVGRSLLDITHRLDYPGLADDASKVFESLHQIEREVHSHDNRWYLARLLPYRTLDDRIEGAVLTFIDITERRLAQEQVRQGEAHMALIAQSTRDHAIITTDPQGVITSWSRGAEAIFGYSEAQACGQDIALIYNDEDRQVGRPKLQLRLAQERGYAVDQRWHPRQDGQQIYCSGVFNPLEDGAVRGFAFIGRDTTREQEHLKKQRVRLKKTQATSLLKDEFMAVMSHELKHPLNLIQLNAELLARSPGVAATDTAVRATAAIQRAVRSQAQIIDDLLDISRLKTGKLKLERQQVDFAQLIADIVAVVKPAGESAGVELSYDAGGAEVWLQADPVRLEQIVWNLLNNALKFTPAGKRVELSLGLEQGSAVLRVTDEGQGIEADFLPRLFDMFGQAELQHSARAKHGLGIGLALVRQLVEAHNGRIEATSEGLGRGSSFCVWLPLPAVTPAMLALAASGPGGLSGLRVLLVDDADEVLEMMCLLLESEGAVVYATADPLLALAAAMAESFEVILSDIGMPGMDGHQLIREIRAEGLNRNTPAIALTGYGRENDVALAREAGFNLHLSKPVSVEALIESVQHLMIR
ncbi:CheR family methyltransferase [Pseudomonas sp. HR96]|uniref:CheR family methyltransferase n=1 Tax=Pseudomonas sp. HR96 TaxID=1027966 RepID=UPI002A75D346|nr:CheR family methyltransferase [Pseudomonas sp. HR96]WPP01567.1 CheR family methyltransferase [Pseudomonas sp. HR96]